MANIFDEPSIDINSYEFFKMVTQVMINKHNDEEDDFNLND